MIQNSQDIPNLSIFTSLPMLKRNFGIDIEEQDYLENARLCLSLIGNLHRKVYQFKETITDKRIKLPCGMMVVEYVTSYIKNNTYPPHVYTESILYYQQSPVYMPIIDGDTKDVLRVYQNNHELYPMGSYVNFRLVQEHNDYYLEFDIDNVEVMIFGLGIEADCDGLPMVTEKEAEAITYYCAYLYKQKMLFLGNQMATGIEFFEKEKNRKINAARTPNRLSQNQMNMILNAMTSWHRHNYNYNTNPIKI